MDDFIVRTAIGLAGSIFVTLEGGSDGGLK
jgi:hypothetical protein